MSSELKSGLLFRAVLPCTLLLAVSCRFNGFSVVYLGLLLLIPLFPSPSARSMTGSTRHFLRAVWGIALAFLLLQGILQLAFSLQPPGGTWENVLGYLGLIRFSRVDAGNIVRLLAPDIGILLAGSFISRMCHKLVKLPRGAASSGALQGLQDPNVEGDGEELEDLESTSEEEEEEDEEEDATSVCSQGSGKEAQAPRQNPLMKAIALVVGLAAAIQPYLPTLGKVLVTLFLGLAGMVSPSITSAVYFGAFLGLGSWWACRRAVSSPFFSTLCVFMAIFTAGHLSHLYTYQLPFFQDLVPPTDIYARLLGMTALIRTDHAQAWRLQLHPGLSWPELLSPLVLLLSYYTLVLLGPPWVPAPAQEDMEPMPTRSPSREGEVELQSVIWTSGSDEDQMLTPGPGGSWQDLPLLRDHGTGKPSSGLVGPALLLQKRKAFSEMTARSLPESRTPETPEELSTDSPLGPESWQLNLSDSRTDSGLLDTSTEAGAADAEPSGLSALIQILMRHSYVPALITMMVWSITHASWLGFVLLLWSCAIWMARDHRSLAMRSAPCLVGYANMLVLLNFAVGLRLSQQELFPGVPDWLLADLDLKLYPQPCLHLGAKSLYAFLFWLLLRQQILERRLLAEAEAKVDSWQEDSVGKSEHDTVQDTALAGFVGAYVKGLLVKYWILVCSAMFFVVSFNGKVAVYKIIYIFLFLSWVALYQIHYEWWRRVLKFFWMAMVCYSMIVLIAIYTYQFRSVAGFFNHTLGLSEEGLRDVGLERFATVELFAKILLPATFLLACILQLHYFNQGFLAATSLSMPEPGTEDAPNAAEITVGLLADMLKDLLRKLPKRAEPAGGKEAAKSGADQASCVTDDGGMLEDSMEPDKRIADGVEQEKQLLEDSVELSKRTLEHDTEPPKDSAVFGKETLEHDTEQSKDSVVLSKEMLEHDTEPSKDIEVLGKETLEHDTEPSEDSVVVGKETLEYDTEPSKDSKAVGKEMLEHDTEPSKDSEVLGKEKLEHDTEPSKDSKVLGKETLEHDTEPSKDSVSLSKETLEHDMEPSKDSMVLDKEMLEHDMELTLGQDAEMEKQTPDEHKELSKGSQDMDLEPGKQPPEKEEDVGEWDASVDKLAAGFLKLLEIIDGTQVFLWRVLEIHIIKFICPVVIWFTLQEVSLMNSLFYISWVVAIPYSSLRPHASHFSTVWACVIVICKMLYQLKSVVPASYSSNCTQVLQGNSTRPPPRDSILIGDLVDPAEWLGALRKCDAAVLPCLKGQLCILALMTLEATVSRHQAFYRFRHQLPEPLTSTITEGVTREQLDEGLLNALRYFINYTFYKFGLELCFLMVLHTMGRRMDFYAVVHGVWLLYLLGLRRRKAIAEMWPRYCGFLVGLSIFQYFLCLGVPPAFCADYPWRRASTEVPSNLIKWLFLPDFAKRPDATLLLFDFLLLLAASLQWQVFVDENQMWMRMQAGDNVEISRDLQPEDIAQLSPVPNFIFCRSYLDMVKVALFRYHFWLVLCLLFFTGTTRISIMGSGYLLGFGYFMLHGSRLLLKPVKFILRPWDRLIAYSVLVMALKTLMSVGGCVYLETLLVSHCWVVHSFGLFCTVSGYDRDLPEDEECELPEKEAGILWDAVCFSFLLIQRRIFLSYYHLYVVADRLVSKAIAPSGAVMLEMFVRTKFERSEEAERKSRLVIAKQMDKIKAKQKKIEEQQQAGRNPQPPEGAEGMAAAGGAPGTAEDGEETKWWQPWVKHPSMVQDGSYSLFETDSEEEEAAEGSDVETQDQRPKPKTAFQLAHDAWTNSSRSALRMRQKDENSLIRAAEEAEGGAESPMAGDVEDLESESGDEDADAPENRTKRLMYMAKFSWVLGKVLLDDVTEAVLGTCRNHVNVAIAFREQRSAWWQAVRQGRKTMPDGPEGLGKSPVREAQPAASSQPPGSPAVPQAEVLLPDLPGKEVGPEETGGRACVDKQEEPPKGRAGSLQPPGSPMPRAARDLELEESDRFFRRLPRLVRLAMALYQFIESRTELLSYFVIILNHTLSASILSIILPILSFLWAMLSNPRPSRRFWMLAVYYTEATVIMKYLSQFGFLPWTTKRYAGINLEKPFSLPNILGIEKKDSFAMCDLFQLLVLFFHRTTMKGLGLWDQQPKKAPGKGKKKKSRRVGKKTGKGVSGGSHLQKQDPPPAVPRWAFWRRQKGVGSNGKAPTWPGHQTPGPAQGKKVPISINPEERRVGRGVARLRRAFRPASPGHPRPGFPKDTLIHAVFPWGARLSPDAEPEVKDCSVSCPGVPQDAGPRKKGRASKKVPLRQKLNRKMLKKLLIKLWKLLVRRTLKIYRPIRQFFYNLTHPLASSRCDVYAVTFIVEAVNFTIILLGYSAFGKQMSAADLAESLSEDKVPEAFLAMILIQFGTMVVDRALYLQKTQFGKCLFQVFLVVGTHFWVFFILPGITERRFGLNWVAQVWYVVKCIYFGLSAYQIKCGYPTRILGNFLTKGFNFVNLILFKGFRFIPFLLELRAVIGWMWTDTALSLSNWICLEDIYANIFIMKCWQESEKKYPQPPGRKKKKVVKYGVGGVITFALIFLMWFPLVFMSLLKTVGGVTNQPLDVSIKIAINGYETLFTMSSQQKNLIPFSEAAYDKLMQNYALHSSAMQFLSNYRPEDIVLVKIKSHASLQWSISPANREAMIRELSNASIVYFTTSWVVKRNVSLVENVEASGKYTTYYTNTETRDQLVQMLTHARKEPVMLPGLIPKALKTNAGTEAKLARQLKISHSHRPQDIDRLAYFRNATVRLQELKPAGPPEASLSVDWWVVQEWWPGCNQGRGCSRDLELIIYNDKVSPQSMGFLAGYGIVGLYVSVVMVAAKFIREHFLGISRSIMFEELPNVDRIFRLCTDIFLVRELGELELEQQLFSKLIFLYRSPETMIKWTRDTPEAPPRRPPAPDQAAAAPAPGEAAGEP